MQGLIRFSVIVPTVVASFGTGILALWPVGAAEPATFPLGDAERGAYLARASGGVACHNDAAARGPALAGGLDDGTRFARSDSLPGSSKAPSILAADLVAGGWTVANLAYALRSGLLRNGDAFGGSMAEVVVEGTSFLTDADRTAIATHLLDPEGTGAIPTLNPRPKQRWRASIIRRWI